MYKTKIQDAKREAYFINRRLLHLPKSHLRIRIRKLSGVWAYAEETETGNYRTILNCEFPSYKLFRDVLAHELIHQWQYYTGDPGTHNKNFFTWRKSFARLGYDILKEY